MVIGGYTTCHEALFEHSAHLRQLWHNSKRNCRAVRLPAKMMEEHYGEYISGVTVTPLSRSLSTLYEGTGKSREKEPEALWRGCVTAKYGGPNGIRTRVTDVRGRNNSATDFHGLPKLLIFFHSIAPSYHELPPVFTDRQPKGDPATPQAHQI